MPPRFDQAATEELKDRTGYEIYLMEDVYKLLGNPLFRDDCVIYPVKCSTPLYEYRSKLEAFLVGTWRSVFQNAGAPLIFVSTFKLLDMLVEWVLRKNGFTDWEFNKKAATLCSSPSPIFPPLIESRLWLKKRLIGFYKVLNPLRSTIIHDKHFTTSGGAIQVSQKKGAPVDISADHLRILATTIISVLRYVDGTWSFDALREMMIRYNLDEVAKLHRYPILKQKTPSYIGVRVYSTDPNPLHVDLTKIRNDLAQKFVDRDCVFDLLVVIVKDSKAIDAYLFPWSVLSEWSHIVDAEQYRTAIPDNITPEHVVS